MRTARIVLLLAGMALLLSGCAEETSVSAGGSAYLSILLTDAPIDLSTVESVFVTIDEVIVYPSVLADGSDPDPFRMTTDAVEFDLLTLTDGATQALAEAGLPAGLYSRIRLGVSQARMVFLDGTEVGLKIESQKVDIPIAFELTVDDTLEITLDFQADASVQVNETASDKYILRPVVTPVPF